MVYTSYTLQHRFISGIHAIAGGLNQAVFQRLVAGGQNFRTRHRFMCCGVVSQCTCPRCSDLSGGIIRDTRKNRVFTCSFKDRCGTRGIIFNELVISTELRSACPAKHSFRAFCDICNTILVFA